MQEKPCEQFGSDRSRQIDSLVEAATGHPCPGRDGGVCPLASGGGSTQAEESHLSVVAS
jgi:hypothetical protein